MNRNIIKCLMINLFHCIAGKGPFKYYCDRSRGEGGKGMSKYYFVLLYGGRGDRPKYDVVLCRAGGSKIIPNLTCKVLQILWYR